MLNLSAGTINCATVGADGLDAGALGVSTSYHVFAIGKTDGTVARLASTSPSSPTMPSGYTLKRRISSFKTNGSSQIINYSQVGNEFYLSASISTVAAVLSTSAVTTITLPIPSGVKMLGKFRAIATSGGSFGVVLYSPEQAAQVFNTPPGNASLTLGATGQVAGDFSIRTDTSASIRGIGGSTSDSLTVSTYGWEDERGRDD